jgi:hypothetical protein
MLEYKGTDEVDVGAGYGVLEYDFFTINGEKEFWSLINYYGALCRHWKQYTNQDNGCK